MGDVKIRYYVTRQQAGRPKNGYWAPCLARPSKKTGKCEPTLMAALGFKHVDCGQDGPMAWAIAQSWNERWDIARASHERGELVPVPTKLERAYLAGSLGEGFARFRATRIWQKKKPRTRQDWERGWKLIEPLFGDVDPSTVALEHLDQWYAQLLERVGVREAHRAMKIWRALWRVIATMRTAAGKKYCERDHDPSLGIRREAPVARQAIWFEGEAVRLVKRAWRLGYRGLAAALAVAWDTMLSPVDVRTLTRAQLSGDADGAIFQLARAKTGKAAIGTLSRRTEALLKTYLGDLPGLHPSAPIFRTPPFTPGESGGKPRAGVAYRADVLGRHFRAVRLAEFPGDRRQLLDFRRSGAVEAKAGQVDPAALADKMANSIDSNKFLQSTYLPADARVVRLADEARARGRSLLRGRGEK